MLEIGQSLFSGGRPIDNVKQDKLKREAIKNGMHSIGKNDLNRLKNIGSETLLHIQAKNGDVESTTNLIIAGSDVNARDHLGKTPIILAIENKLHEYLKVVNILCKSNADIHITDRYGKSAAQLIISDNTDINNPLHQLFLGIIHRECMYKSQITAEKLMSLHCPLWQAVLLRDAEVIEHMLLRGSLVDSCDPKKRFTALTRAVQLMDLEIVKVLIKYGANVNFVDFKGFLPIAHYGSYNYATQKPEIIGILLSKTILSKDTDEKAIVRQLKRPFECGNREVIRMLLEYYKNISNIRDVGGSTALHYLCSNIHSDITEELQGKQIDVNVCDYMGCSPLHKAADNPLLHINTFKFLLENGANVNAKTDYTEAVPLFHLCTNYLVTETVYNNIIDLLLQYNVDIQFINSKQITVFDLIVRRKSFYMSEPLLAYLALLDESKKPIVEGIRNKIDSYAIFKEFFDICKAELAKMKNSSINKKLTLYMILTNQINGKRILKSCRFDPNSLMKFENFKKLFDSRNPYHCLIQKRVSSIVLKLELFQNATNILCNLLKIRNDHIVVTEIIDYLDNQDLQNLLKV